MTGSALDLLFEPDDEGTFQLVQEGGAGARRQPGPTTVPIPKWPGEGGAQQRRAPQPQLPTRPQPRPPQSTAAPKSAVDTLFDDDETTPPVAAAPPSPSQPPSPEVTPRLAGQRRGNRDMLDRVRDYIGGKQDPRYAGVKGISEADLASADTGESTDLSAMSRAKMFAGSDDAYGNIIKRQLGPAFRRFEADAHGAKVLVFADRDGREQKRYVNQPGLDWQDVDRALFGAVPYMATGAAVAKAGLGLAGNALAQGLGAMGTRYAADTGANLFMGSNEPVDWGAAGIMGIAGAGGALLSRPAGNIERARVRNSIVDREGSLSERGADLARRAGLEPDELAGNVAREFADTYAKTGKLGEAGVRAGTVEFGIPVSRGQLTKNPDQLLVEKNTRAGLYGSQAKDVVGEFDRSQVAALHDAALGTMRGQPFKREQSIAEAINSGRGIADMGPDPLGRAIREGVQDTRAGAKSAETAAWGNVGDAYASKTALADLPSAVQGRLKTAGMEVDESLMPASKRMGEIIRDYIGGKSTAGPVPEVFGKRADVSVDDMRRRLLGAYNSAAPKSADQKAAKAIYDAYDDWLASSADALVTTGRPDAIQFAAQQRIARDVTKDIRETFEPTFKGKNTPAANIIEKVMSAEKGASAEGVVDTLFGAVAKRGSPKEGVEHALINLKKALNNPEWAGAENNAWNDIRLAYWTRIVQDKMGNVYAPQTMLNNLQNAITHQASVMRVLYEPAEQAKMVRFATALRHIAWKDPNPSGTGTAIALQTREFITTMMKGIGWQTNGPAGLLAGMAMNPIRNAMGAAGARASVAQTAPRIIDPNLAPYMTSLTQGGLRTDLGGQPNAD